MSTNIPPRLRLTGIAKSFGATRALDGVDMEVATGEVHAIIGENGAGKSTLMKVLSGAHLPDVGEVYLDGRKLELFDPRQSQAAGIAMIYQELNLAPDMSVADNITLGREPKKFGRLIRSQQRVAVKQALAKLHCDDLDLDQPARNLSIAQQQMVEIARAVLVDPASSDALPGESNVGDNPLKLLILDEPTSSLTRMDTENLFEVIEKLKDEGVSILYISHFLEECERIADRFTVLRDGRSVGSGWIGTSGSSESEPDAGDSPNEPTPMSEIVKMMVGRPIDDLYPHYSHVPGDPVLELSHVSGQEQPTDVSLTLRRGEIFGLAGLIGAGRTETVRAIFGLDQFASGKVSVLGQSTQRRTPTQSWKADAMGLVSEDRKNEGLFLTRSLTDNLTITKTGPYRVGPFAGSPVKPLLHGRKMREATQRWMEELDVKANDPDQLIGELSGGNQQKIAFGRLLHHDCEILLLDEPTRGIDIGSKSTIYQSIGKLAAQGKAILLVSSYLPELLGLCDTIGVVSRGRLVDVQPASQWDEHSLLTKAIGQAD